MFFRLNQLQLTNKRSALQMSVLKWSQSQCIEFGSTTCIFNA